MLDPRRWTRYDALWLTWLLAFLAIEIPALLDARKGNTFSEAFWWLTSANTPQARGHRRVIRVVALAFTAWLVTHLWKKDFV